MTVRTQMAGPDAAPVVLGLVGELLEELGEEGDEAGVLDATGLEEAWRSCASSHLAFLAWTDEEEAVGVATLSVSFALYAQGEYGIINEMYVTPEYRSRGVGAALVEAIKSHGRAQGWRRIDVTAPESKRWERTNRFYEEQGFVFTGPKLKFQLD